MQSLLNRLVPDWLSSRTQQVRLVDKPLPEPEPICATPRKMTGLFASLSAEQKKLVLSYRGDECVATDGMPRRKLPA